MFFGLTGVGIQQNVSETPMIIINFVLTLTSHLTKLPLGQFRIHHGFYCFLTLFVQLALVNDLIEGRVE